MSSIYPIFEKIEFIEIMRFKIKLENKSKNGATIPINYQYPLSAAIYKILAKGDAHYAQFLHEEGYGKGYKFFTFSDLKLKYRREGDRFILLNPLIEFIICFHLPDASKTFIEGLFRSEEIVIADHASKTSFGVQSIISLENPLKEYAPNEIIQVTVKPASALFVGYKKYSGNYEFLNPDHEWFNEGFINTWANKIAAAWDEKTALDSILMVEVEKYKQPFRSRLVTIKAASEAETKIKGYLNFKLKLTAERRFIELLLHAGAGLYAAQGMGCLELIHKKANEQ